MAETYIFMGRAGAGKGVQATLLSQYFKKKKKPIFFLEFHKLREQFLNGESPAKKMIRKQFAAGKMMPKFLAISLWSLPLLSKFTGKENLIVDGIPRHLFEAEAFDSLLQFFDRKRPILITINVSRNTAKDRLLRRGKQEGRPDDLALSSINRRLNWYQTETVPAITFFKRKSRYRCIEIDGEESVETVHRKILRAIRA